MSTNPRIYLDFNATAPLIPAAREAILAVTAALAAVGNPSSIHREGRMARDLIEVARGRVAALVGRPREQVVFTSGGTEANALGVLGLAGAIERRGGPRVVVGSSIDHPSLRGAVAALAQRGWEVRMLAVTPDGALVAGPATDAGPAAAAGLAALLEGAGLLAVAAVNHELGTLADIAGLAAAARAAGALVHVDAVQAAGKLDLAAIPADSLAISAHKLGGPAGAGALALGPDDALPLLDGGHQERGRRPGTENVVGIAGLGAAAAAAAAGLATWPEVAALGDRLERVLLALPGVRIHGSGAPRVGGTVNAGFAGALGESIVVALDLAGIAASTGAACTSGSVQPSPVLLALGLSPREARSAVRFSLGRSTTAAEIDAVLERLPAIVARARAHAPPA
ncbi:MAG TPA: aminotransferase class V-fold PLP-dependent enzyme [Kofleriaceae bacterium]|nr:aminotransferase class V-fold PLP-dependent enzyme [Kofleriaceae bacterium]